ncbi:MULTISPECIES: PmoA family protein [unclassified Microbacterium]|uniref:DUF6807 domain-containing protein n=1 Tax=unclassified Microbacterium TaxID=2609290 RepID=UPI0030170C47
MQAHADGHALTVVANGTEVLRYVFAPDTPQIESPKPYAHPVRTLAGHVVTAFRPWDHVWHTGLAWALPIVENENFWGGGTYVRGQGYVDLPNNGAQRHVGVSDLASTGGGVRFAHDLAWITQSGETMFTEMRTVTARLLDEDAWALTFSHAMTNVTDRAIPLGSPTTRGRANAGYGGLFWRGPRSFAGGTIVTPGGVGTGDDVRGSRQEWAAFEGRHDGVDATSLILMKDTGAAPARPVEWFARTEEFAALCPAPFFHAEQTVAPAETAAFQYAVAIVDGDRDAAPRIAAALESLAPLPAI